jgi:membrane protease YdiL (CAAX protease family)
MMAFWIPRLVRDGWRLSHVTLPFAGLDLLRGAAIYVVSILTYWTTWVAASLVVPDFVHEAARVHVGGRVSWWTIALASVLNPVFEESLYLGFVANVLQRRSPGFALLASVLVRLGVHLYQGPLAPLAIFPIGLVFTSYYLTTNRIWPAVVAHALADAFALAWVATGAA